MPNRETAIPARANPMRTVLESLMKRPDMAMSHPARLTRIPASLMLLFLLQAGGAEEDARVDDDARPGEEGDDAPADRGRAEYGEAQQEPEEGPAGSACRAHNAS